MRATVLTAPGTSLKFDERDDPLPGSGAVRVLTRNSGSEFFKAVAEAGSKTHTTPFPLREANEVLAKVRSGQITSAAVLQP